MSSSSNSFLRGQRKSDLLELAGTVGLEKYVQNLSLIKLSRLLRDFFAMRELASGPATASSPARLVELSHRAISYGRVASQYGCAPSPYAQPQATRRFLSRVNASD